MGLCKTKSDRADQLASLTDAQLGQAHDYVGYLLHVVGRRFAATPGHTPPELVDAHGRSAATVFKVLDLLREFYDAAGTVAGRRPVKNVDVLPGWTRTANADGTVTLTQPTPAPPAPVKR